MTETKKVPAKKAVLENSEPSLWEIFTKGILKENGLFVMVLGMCPALAVTATFEGAFGMSVLVVLVLTLTNITISAIRKLIPNTVRIPVYVIIIATEVTILKMLVSAFAPALDKELGIFIALITVNCIILGRAESFASKNNVVRSALDGFGVALGFGLALSVIGLVREFLGTGMLVLGKTLPLGFEYTIFQNAGLDTYAFSILVQPPGAFLVIGFLLAGITAFRQRKEAKK
ncbi:MAG: electron transport complex subunit RsxE [Firmicutes bacterium]|nr:electron transport complex subunit RsxE [Bacillota bacterium]